VKDFSAQVDQALLAKTEAELDAAGALFDEFIVSLREESFNDFESFYRLANFLIQEYWPNCGMFAEISSQLFAEYEIGFVEWIWRDPQFMKYCSKFLENDIHFGCFVLTEGCSNENFTTDFAKKALTEDCEICAEVGDGWLAPKAYVCENPTSSAEILIAFSEIAFKLFDSGLEEQKYESVMMLRALAGNSKTSIEILKKLTEVSEQSIRHEIRNQNSGMDPEQASRDSYVDWKARQTLQNL